MNEKQVKDNRRLRREHIRTIKAIASESILTSHKVQRLYHHAQRILQLDDDWHEHKIKAGCELASQGHDPSEAKGKE